MTMNYCFTISFHSVIFSNIVVFSCRCIIFLLSVRRNKRVVNNGSLLVIATYLDYMTLGTFQLIYLWEGGLWFFTQGRDFYNSLVSSLGSSMFKSKLYHAAFNKMT